MQDSSEYKIADLCKYDSILKSGAAKNLFYFKIEIDFFSSFKGGPFETMPRLRVLSMRNNRLRTIKERTFRNLRGNIAILDVDGMCTWIS